MAEITTKAEKFKIKVEKAGRKWAQIKVYYPSGYVGKAKIDKTAVNHIPVGSKGTVLARRHTRKNSYGAETTLLPVKNETEMTMVNTEQLYRKFLAAIEEGYIPTGIVEKIQASGCHNYDEVIRKKQVEFLVSVLEKQADEGMMGSSEYAHLESLLLGSEKGVVLTRLKVRETWARIKKKFEEGQMPATLIGELYALGSHEHDTEIAAEAERIKRQRQATH